MLAPELSLRLIPAAFVILWSTGFIGARFGLPYAEPMTLLAIRMALAAVIMAGWSWAAGLAWPRTPKTIAAAVIAGLTLHATYLGGVFVAIALHVPAGVTAIIVALQPLLTGALAGRVLGEQVGPRRWLGLLLGLAGVAAVVWEKVAGEGVPLWGVVAALTALAGITIGSLVQKKYGGGVDPRPSSTISYAVALIPLLIGSVWFETQTLHWTGDLIFALVWLTLVLSVLTIPLLFILIRRGDASKVAALMYLAPPLAALQGWLFFGETLGPLALAGMAAAALGVALAAR